MLVCASVHPSLWWCTTYLARLTQWVNARLSPVTNQRQVRSKAKNLAQVKQKSCLNMSIYRKMLADYFEQSEEEAAKRVEEFELKVKERFIKEPGQSRFVDRR